MKNRLAVLIALLFLFSCKKNDSLDVANPANQPDISAVPSHFNQKLLLEQFTSGIGGQCPKADLFRDSLLRLYPGRVYSMAVHVMDLMTDSSITNPFSGVNALDSFFNPSSIYPAGMINREVAGLSDLSPDNWAAKMNADLGDVPRCGLAIDAQTITGNMLTISVHVGFSNTMAGDYRLHVMLVQNLVQTNDSLYGQINDFSEFGLTPDSTLSLYNLPDTIYNYAHRNVMKRIVSDYGLSGDGIPAPLMFTGNEYIKNYYVNLTGINTSNTYILAFVDKYGTTGTSHRIENVQKVGIGEVKDWN